MFSFTFYWENFVFKSTGKKEFSGTFNGHYTFLGKKKKSKNFKGLYLHDWE